MFIWKRNVLQFKKLYYKNYNLKNYLKRYVSLVIYEYFSNLIKNYNRVKNLLLQSLLRSKYFIIISEKNGRKRYTRISKILKSKPSKILQI